MAKTATKTSTKRCSNKPMKRAAAARSGKRCEAIADSANMPAGKDEVTIDRRRPSERRGEEAESAATAAAPALERRQKVNRRRQIDPTTCERDYTDQEVEFMNALDEYKRKSGRMFPTCSEVLEVINSLGYVKLRRPTTSCSRRPARDSSEADDRRLAGEARRLSADCGLRGWASDCGNAGSGCETGACAPRH